MPYLSRKQLEPYRPTVTGIGWASTKQAALYTGLAHRDLCTLLEAGEIKFSRIGRKRRVRYAELDRFMAGYEVKDIIDINELLEGLR